MSGPSVTIGDRLDNRDRMAEVPRSTIARLPEIDYGAHPAYRVSAIPVGVRARALLRFFAHFAFVGLKRAIDYDNLPLLTKSPDGGARPGIGSVALPFLKMLFRVKCSRFWERLRGARRAPIVALQDLQAREILGNLRADGFSILNFAAPEMDRLRSVFAPSFEKLSARRRNIPVPQRLFDDNFLWLRREDTPEEFALIEEIFNRHRIIDAAGAYLGRPVGIKHVNPQLNDEADSFWRGQFEDLNLPDARTTYLHTDTTYGMLKCMVYVSNVTLSTGPFTYIRGTNSRGEGFWEGLIRRANDYSGLSSKRPERRRHFAALPRFFRKKCDFGSDIRDGSPDSQSLMRSKVEFTSDMGDAILFDGNGIHRGGMVQQGERRVVTVILAEV